MSSYVVIFVQFKAIV